MRRDLDRQARTVVASRTARSSTRTGALWGLVFGVYVATSALGYASTYPTAAARQRFATSLGGNAGLAALIGPARHLETVAGYTSWRAMGVLTVVGAIWGMLLATGSLRGEEEQGRWELYLAGRTTRRSAANQAACGIGAGLLSGWAVTAAICVAAGTANKVMFSTIAALYLATCLMAGAVLFTAVGLLAGQLAGTRRQANGAAAGVLGASYLVRMAADSSTTMAWLRWASPLGWPEELRPLVGPNPVALIPIVATVGALSATAIIVAGRRDLGAGALPQHDAPPARTRLLTGPTGLSARLTRPVAVGWVAGLAVLGLVLGLVAQSASGAISGSAAIQKAIARLGGHRGGAASYMGIAFLTAAVLVAFDAAAQVAATRNDEAQGYLDNLLARPLSRRRWMAGRLAVGAVVVSAAGVVAGVFGWIGAATQHSGVGFGVLVQAGVNVVPPGLFVLGAGAVAFGVRPRWSAGIAYGVVGWSFLVEFLASVVKSNRLLLDTSLFSHITPAPAANPNWTSLAWLSGLGVLGALVGIALFDRRDLVSE